MYANIYLSIDSLHLKQLAGKISLIWTQRGCKASPPKCSHATAKFMILLSKHHYASDCDGLCCTLLCSYNSPTVDRGVSGPQIKYNEREMRALDRVISEVGGHAACYRFIARLVPCPDGRVMRCENVLHS